MRPMKFGMGQPVRRVEDKRFVTGAGHYATDALPEKTLHAYVLRSPHAHATFRFTDLETARAMKGVKLVLTHAEVAHLGDLPCKGTIQTADGSQVKPTPYPVLPKDTVRHVGEAVAMIVADTIERARDAAEAIGIDYATLAAVTDPPAAIRKGAPLVWPDRPGNVAFVAHQGKKDRTDAAFAKAARTVSLTIVNNRLVSSYMEPRAIVAEYEAKTKSYTLTMGSQGSHGVRDLLCAYVLNIDPKKMRVITPDVGGGFGTKIFLYREYPLVCVAAERLKRPVKWVSDRTEHFLSCTHGRANYATATMALDEKGKFLGLRVEMDADMGSTLSQYGPFIPWVGTTMTSGCYDIPAVHVTFRGILTHTTPVDAYRGAGRPEAAYLIERLVDEIARQTGRKPEAVRAQNFVKPKQMPYRTQTGPVYDSGEFEGHMRRAMEVADWKGFPARARTAARKGLARGIGMASYIEACGGGGPESAWITIEKDGSATVKSGTQSNGQGHETAYAQLVSQELDLAMDKIRVMQGDTATIEHGSGTGGSRSIPVGGAAMAGAARKIAENLKKLAADKLETAMADLEIANGGVRVAGTDKRISFADIAKLPGATPEMLNVKDTWKPPEATYPNGTHVAEIEIDKATGKTRVVGYWIVDDFGVTLNPLLLAGQVHGGTVQGIGQALMEEVRYDSSGQLITASYMDYAMPRAADMPAIHFETRNVRCVTNAIGVKGAGEAGAIGSCPAIMNAVIDALARNGSPPCMDMPATAPKLRKALALKAAE